jgi:hypothetical protein
MKTKKDLQDLMSTLTAASVPYTQIILELKKPEDIKNRRYNRGYSFVSISNLIVRC